VAKPKSPSPEQVRMDLTPMIDVVFQLLIFFVLVTEMAQAEIEALTLPTADQAVADVDADRHRLILNVNRSGDVVWRRRTLNAQAMAEMLALHARTGPREPGNPALSARAVLIRGDARAEYQGVQRIMQACAKVGIWKLELAAAAPPPR
jgi:biopolymer transport protein ExbD